MASADVTAAAGLAPPQLLRHHLSGSASGIPADLAEVTPASTAKEGYGGTETVEHSRSKQASNYENQSALEPDFRQLGEEDEKKM